MDPLMRFEFCPPPLWAEHWTQLFPWSFAGLEAGDEPGQVMQPAPQCPHPRHPGPLAIEVTAQAADPQHRLADRQLRRLHPRAEVAHQDLNLVCAQHLRSRRLRGLPRQVPHDTIRAATAALTVTAFS